MLTRDIFGLLIKNGFSKEWIQKTPFRNIFWEYLMILENTLIEKAEQWAIEQLYEIERIANEKIKCGNGDMEDNTPGEVDKIRIKLSNEKFKINKGEN